MADNFGVSGSSEGTPNPFGTVNHGYNTSKKNNYITIPTTFCGDSIEFEWWKMKMHTHIIGLDDDLHNIFEDDIDIQVNGVGMVSDRKSLTPAHKMIYRKYHRVRGIFVDSLPHSGYIKTIDKSTSNTIFNSQCSTFEGSQQAREAKVNLLI